MQCIAFFLETMHYRSFFVRSCVRFVTSDRSGMGKSLYIKRLADNLKLSIQPISDVFHVVIPLHGPAVTPDTVLELFKDHAKTPTCCIYHIDIAPNVSYRNHYSVILLAIE